MKNGKKIALGAVIAGVVGYAAGILTAPKSGKETRKDIQKAAQKAKTEAEKKLKALHSELTSLIDQGKKLLSNATTKSKTELQKALDAAMAAKEKARNILSAVHEGDAEDKDLDRAVKEATKALEYLKKFVTKKNA